MPTPLLRQREQRDEFLVEPLDLLGGNDDGRAPVDGVDDGDGREVPVSSMTVSILGILAYTRRHLPCRRGNKRRSRISPENRRTGAKYVPWPDKRVSWNPREAWL